MYLLSHFCCHLETYCKEGLRTNGCNMIVLVFDANPIIFKAIPRGYGGATSLQYVIAETVVVIAKCFLETYPLSTPNRLRNLGRYEYYCRINAGIKTHALWPLPLYLPFPVVHAETGRQKNKHQKLPTNDSPLNCVYILFFFSKNTARNNNTRTGPLKRFGDSRPRILSHHYPG